MLAPRDEMGIGHGDNVKVDEGESCYAGVTVFTNTGAKHQMVVPFSARG